MQKAAFQLTEKVKEILSGEATGHDWHHIRQVRDMALRIAKVEGGDREIIELAALAHDIGDRKLRESEEEGIKFTREVLLACGVHEPILGKIMDIIVRVSFKGAGVADDMPTLEGKIVQDADRLYALGAIGIARTFAYGGKMGRPIYDPNEKIVHATNAEQYYAKPTSTVGHFEEKLLHLAGRMHTKTAKSIAERRDAYLRNFLSQFMSEWEAKD
jgi:uncharacterized protein